MEVDRQLGWGEGNSPLRRGSGILFNVPLARALPGRSLAELGFLVPSKLPQGSLEPRDSAPSGGASMDDARSASQAS